MSIDLTKPIRRKWDHLEVQIRHGYIGHWLSPQGIWHEEPISPAQLERDYENIPEPRKPRELWVAFEVGNYPVKRGERAWVSPAQYTEYTKYIEWPEGAPLPEWPGEGS